MPLCQFMLQGLHSKVKKASEFYKIDSIANRAETQYMHSIVPNDFNTDMVAALGTDAPWFKSMEEPS